jgi:Protein of unknown function, DUF547
MKYSLKILGAVCAFSAAISAGAVHAANSPTGIATPSNLDYAQANTAQYRLAADAPRLPTAHSKRTKITLKYDDMDYLLKNLVLPVGRSEHKRASRGQKVTGTNFIRGNPNPSRLEGNRVMFHFIHSKDESGFVKDVRDTLLALPDQIDFTSLSRNEQLAYWLNLHNSIVIAEMAKRYPFKKVDRLYGDCEVKSKRFACQRNFEAFGQKISVTDIRNHVLANWKDPIVIYGFYMGAVGTPNILVEAYTAKNLARNLNANATDFVNSIRGTRPTRGKRMVVSSYYALMAQQFPDFQPDLLNHIRKYARTDFRRKIARVEFADPKVKDWYIADLFNGASQTAPANLYVNGRSADFRYPAHVQELITGIVDRYRRRQGTVTIEEVRTGISDDLEVDAPEDEHEHEHDDESVSTPQPTK